MKVMKRNGTEVIFDITKIIAAITKANNTIEEDARMTPVQIQAEHLQPLGQQSLGHPGPHLFAQPGDLLAAKVVAALVRVAREAWTAADDSEEVLTDDGRAHRIIGPDFDALSDALDALDELPDDQPGCVMNGPARAEWALRNLLCSAA